MSAIGDAFVYLNDPANWSGDDGFVHRTIQHVALSGIAVGIAMAIALPLALWLGHTGRGGTATVVVANVSRALPTLALLTILATFPSLGIGTVPTIISLAVFAIPPLLTNTYVGMRGVDAQVKEAARGMGMSEAQLLRKVEFPIAVPLIAAGVRTAAVQVVATATLAALIGGGGLGLIIVVALAQQNTGQLLAGGIVVAVLALLVEGLGALVERALTPAAQRGGLRRRRPRRSGVRTPA